MSHSWNQFLVYCLLCSLVIVGGEAFAKDEEAASSDSATTNTAVENTSKKDVTKSNVIEATNDEVVEDKVVKDEVVKDNVNAEKDAVKEIKTSVLLINVRQNGMNGLPIKNARVMVTHDGGKEYVNQTDDAGIVMLSDLPYGKIDVDVTSSGRKSDADSLVLDEPQETLTFQLKPRPPAE